MAGKLNFSISKEPFWLLEAMACMNYVEWLDSDEWLNKSNGQVRRMKEEFLLPYRSYRGEMRARLKPVLEQYPMLLNYVDNSPRKLESLQNFNPPMITFLEMMQHVLEAKELPAEKELEKELNHAFQRMLSDEMRRNPDVGETSIQNIQDVMAVLENQEMEDADKFKLLRLYSERREVIEQLWSIQGACEEIGRSCLALVQERFDACMEKLQKPENLEALLTELGLQLQFGEKYSCRLTPAVMQCNVVMVHEDEKESGADNSGSITRKIRFGIEAFHVYELRYADIYNDDRLLDRLKALGDSTRLKIMHHLVECPSYLQELSKKLELTPATVLHHLGILMSEGLIEIQMTGEKKRVYYQINKQGLQEVSQGIMQLAMTRQERETQKRERQMQDRQQKQGGGQWKI